MKRYIIFMMKTLQAHGVVIETKTPALLGPHDPRKAETVKYAMMEAGREAYRLGQCAPQLIFVILPGR